MSPLAKTLVIAGLALVAAGLFAQFGARFLPLGRLPGDIAIEGERTRFYFPVVTCILLSLALSAGISIIRYFNK